MWGEGAEAQSHGAHYHLNALITQAQGLQYFPHNLAILAPSRPGNRDADQSMAGSLTHEARLAWTRLQLATLERTLHLTPAQAVNAHKDCNLLAGHLFWRGGGQDGRAGRGGWEW